MSHDRCEHEDRITRGVTTGSLDGDLVAHARTCPICRDIVLAAGWLRAQAERHVSIPDSGLVWWKARLGQAQIRNRHSAIRINLARGLALAITVAAMVGFLKGLLGSGLGAAAIREVLEGAEYSAPAFLPLVCLTVILFAANLVLTVRSWRGR